MISKGIRRQNRNTCSYFSGLYEGSKGVRAFWVICKPLDEAEEARAICTNLSKKQRSNLKVYEECLISKQSGTDAYELQLCIRKLDGDANYHNKSVRAGCSAGRAVSSVLSDRLSSRPTLGWSQIGADRMSKLRCYERNYGREKLIDLIRYSREQRSMKRKGTDNIAVEKVSMREIMTDHYDQSRSYIDRLQVTIPGLTAKKMASIRTNLKLL